MSKKSKDPVVATLSGAVAGAMETLVVWPMESAKTKMQLAKYGQYSGMLDVMRQTVKADGVGGMYRGLLPVLVGSVPKAGIRFGVFNSVESKLRLEDGSTTPMRNLGAGMTAGAIEAVTVTALIETTKTKLIHGNTSFAVGVKQVIQAEGIAGLYKGVGATVGKQATNQGLRFMAFGKYKSILLGDSGRQLRAEEALLGGMMAGCFSTLCNNPLDLVKSKMQGLNAAEYKNMADCFVKVVKGDGVLALWSGTIPRLARVVPGQGVIFASYETISQFVAKTTGRT